MNKELKIKTIPQLLEFVETIEKATELVDYINNLQKENERLNKDRKELIRSNTKLREEKIRINYAIEYIYSHYDLATEENVEFCILRDRVLGILKGE